jgi:hypothetical protein
MVWTDGPDGLNPMFPAAIARDGVERGLERARSRGLGIVGAWLGLEVDPSPLADAGFEEGWPQRPSSVRPGRSSTASSSACSTWMSARRSAGRVWAPGC